MRPILVAGVGNRAMGDDSIGVRVTQMLAARYEDDQQIQLVSVESSIMRLLHLLPGRRAVLLVDCAHMGDPPGTLRRCAPEELRSRKRQGWGHESDLLSVLALSSQLGELPPLVVIIAIQPAIVAPGDGLSPMLSSRFDGYVAAVRNEIRALTRLVEVSGG